MLNLYMKVTACGGYVKVCENNKWAITRLMGYDSDMDEVLKKTYYQYLEMLEYWYYFKIK
ncbi:putative transcription factor & chromatin remodeling ARID family [Helianthus debilis subsp. tardiflorus]